MKPSRTSCFQLLCSQWWKITDGTAEKQRQPYRPDKIHRNAWERLAGEDKRKAGLKKKDGPNLAVEGSQIMEESRRKPFERQAMIANPLLIKSSHWGKFTVLNSIK